ncbi:MAG: thioredoxin domain-containing protein [Blastocatellia bacterium]|nr:thioredoxin domain-containing protein [Blastocatellia bacterium]
MAKETEKKNKEIETKKSNAPALIIGGVLLVALLGGWYWISSSRSATPAANNAARPNANAPAKTSSIPPNAPAGATPPNFTGSPTAQVTVEEFADYQCGSCATAHPVLNEIKSMYGSRIKFVFRNFPLLNMHDKAYDAAVIAEAAGLQGKFWDMQNQLFINQSTWISSPNYKQLWNDYAQKIGLDTARLGTDVAGLAAKGRVDADLQRAKAIGVTGTPTIYVNGQSIGNTIRVDVLKTAIDAELQKVSAPAANPAPANANQ